MHIVLAVIGSLWEGNQLHSWDQKDQNIVSDRDIA